MEFRILLFASLLVLPRIHSVPSMARLARNADVDADEPMKIDLTTNNRYYEYTENQTMDFNCSVTGDFKETLTLTLGEKFLAQGQKVVRFSGPAAIENKDQQLKCTLTDDNQIILSQIGRIITVFYAPRSDNCEVDSVCMIYGTFVVGQNATVRVRIRANPKPYLYQWTTADNNDLDRDRFKQLDAGDSKFDERHWVAELVINEVRPEDFNTNFTFLATNDYGSVSFSFAIAAKETESSVLEFNPKTQEELETSPPARPFPWMWTTIGIIAFVAVVIATTTLMVFYRKKTRKRGNKDAKNPEKIPLTKPNEQINQSDAEHDDRTKLAKPPAGEISKRLKDLIIKKDSTMASLNPEEVEALRILPLLSRLSIIDEKVELSLLAHTFGDHDVILNNDTSNQEFIARARKILKENSEVFKNAKKLVQDKFNNMVITQKRLDIDSIHQIDLKLSSEVSEKVKSWKSGEKICGLRKDADKIIFAQLLQNYIPNLFYLAASDFLNFKLKDSKFSGVLVVIEDNQKNDFSHIPPTTMAKIIRLVNTEPGDYDLTQEPAKLEHLDQESQDHIKRMKVHFMGNEMEAQILLGEEIDKYSISEILNFECSSATEIRNESFYFEQRISSEDKDGFNGTVDEFASKFHPEDCDLISGARGGGKSVAMMRIVMALRKRFPHYCIIHSKDISKITTLPEITNNLDDVCKTVVGIVRQESIAHNVHSEEILKNIIKRKLEKKEAILLMDNITLLRKEVVKSFINILKNCAIGVVVATRYKAVLGQRFFDPKTTYHLKLVERKDRRKFVAEYVESFGGEIEETAQNVLVKEFEENDELWGLPSNLKLVAKALLDDTRCTHNPIKLLIKNAIKIALKNVEEDKIFSLSKELLKKVYRLAVCDLLTLHNYSEVQFDKNDTSVSYMSQFPFLTMYTLAKTVYFTHKRISEYLVAEALVKAFHQNPDVNKSDFTDVHIETILRKDEFRRVRSCMEEILQTGDFRDQKCKTVNGELKCIRTILIELSKENQKELQKMLESCHINSEFNQVSSSSEATINEDSKPANCSPQEEKVTMGIDKNLNSELCTSYDVQGSSLNNPDSEVNTIDTIPKATDNVKEVTEKISPKDTDENTENQEPEIDQTHL